MKPLSIDDIFAIFEPLTYTFEGTEVKVLKQNISTVTIDNPCVDCLTMQLQFSGILNTSATSVAGLTFDFTLFKVSEESQILTTFTLTQQFNTENLTNNRAVNFEFSIGDDLIKNPAQFKLELTSISVTAASNVEIAISGTILGLAVPSV